MGVGVSTLLVFAAFIGVKKSEEKQGIIKWILITIWAYWSFLALAAQGLTFFHIKCTGTVIICINIIAFLGLLILGLKKKENQKYCFDWGDLVILCITVGIGYFLMALRFGKSLDFWAFESGDSALHMQYALQFWDNGTTIPQCFHQVAAGWMYHIVGALLKPHQLFRFYLVQEILMFACQGAFFWIFLQEGKACEKCWSNLSTFILYLIFLIGWPYNNMIMGFAYHGTAITLIICIMICIRMYDAYLMDKKLIFILLILFNYGLFVSYCLFAPVVIGAEIILLANRIRSNKDFIYGKRFIVLSLIAIFFISIAGYMIFVKWFQGDISSLHYLALKGMSYNGSWKDYFPACILLIMCISPLVKELREFNVETVFAICFLCASLLMKGLNCLEYVSDYYLSKFDYTIWLFLFVYIGILLQNYKEKRAKLFSICFIGVWILVIFCCEIPQSKMKLLFPIYNYNFHTKAPYVTEDLMELYVKAGRIAKTENIQIDYKGSNESWQFYTFCSVTGQRYEKLSEDSENGSRKYICVWEEYIKEIPQEREIYYGNDAGYIVIIS